MNPSEFEGYLLGRIHRGDIVLIEYRSTYRIDGFAWGFVIPALARVGSIVIWDFFGIGNLLFKNYARKMKGEEYVRILELLKDVRIVKIGPGSISYGEVIEEVTPSYRVQDFIKNYYTTIQRMERLPLKPTHVITFGLANYINFGGNETLKHILTALSTIPMEDWATLNFVNVDILTAEQLAILEEIAAAVFFVSEDGIKIKKGGEIFDSRGG
ncbi:DUF257 family protein [Thermococcus sp. 21S7]|uniref:DUF257 family protein n=1 Tax=Thermococcus sp. 21S7 TaxID=1638221 RepID=UPI0014387115|nr:DUF257 family protein [Thermococcus sp. 21S7]NJE60347.1 biotin synthase [Thermococcus sp. 21S7]